MLALLHHLRSTSPVGPGQLLAARYASGEIDDEENHRRLDTLQRTSTGAAAD